MWLNNLSKHWLARRVAGAESSKPRRQPARHPRLRLLLEQLEDRHLPSSFTAATVSDLIADINSANLAGGSNTIALVAGSTFALAAANNSVDGPTGLPVIAANDNLTILGNGDTIERKAGTSTAFRLLDVAAGAALTLNNLTLQGGLLSDGEPAQAGGGAILSRGALTLNGVIVQNNTVQASNFGGGVCMLAGTATLSNVTVSGNIATGQGLNGGGAWGGGLYFAGGTVSLSNVMVSGNTAQGGDAFNINFDHNKWHGNGGNGYGGGLYLDATLTAVTLRGVTVENNSAKGGHGSGGGTDGMGFGGGLYIAAPAASVCLDAFTVAHVINNSADLYPNIYGSYTICP